MEQIRAIQEIVDESKDKIPTGMVTNIMAECQKAHKAQPELYTLTWTTVDSHAHVQQVEGCGEEGVVCVTLEPKVQTLIVEAVDEEPLDPRGRPGWRVSGVEMPHHGMMLRSWLRLKMPHYVMHGEDSLVVLHSIVPYVSQKRARDAI